MVRPISIDKKYVPRLPIYQESESLHVFLSRFGNLMKAAEISLIQWVSHLRDILTGTGLWTIQDLSVGDKASYNTVHDKLLASQNLTSDHYRLQFRKAAFSSDQSFSDYISTLKNMFNRWLQLSHDTPCQNLYDLMIKAWFFSPVMKISLHFCKKEILRRLQR